MRGQAIAAVSIISSAETFLVPHRVIERRLLELCLQGAVHDIKVSGQSGEAETQNALMVMRLVEDFIFTPGDSSFFERTLLAIFAYKHSCFSSLSTGYMFSSTCHWLQV